jgi:hypothetical protein
VGVTVTHVIRYAIMQRYVISLKKMKGSSSDLLFYDCSSSNMQVKSKNIAQCSIQDLKTCARLDVFQVCEMQLEQLEHTVKLIKNLIQKSNDEDEDLEYALASNLFEIDVAIPQFAKLETKYWKNMLDQGNRIVEKKLKTNENIAAFELRSKIIYAIYYSRMKLKEL